MKTVRKTAQRTMIAAAGASLTLLMALAVPASAQHYTRTDLTADQRSISATAPNLDPNLVNSWGLARSSTSAWWIADNHSGLSTLYDGKWSATVAGGNRSHA